MQKRKKLIFLVISSTGGFPNINILIDNQKLIRKLHDNGMCDAFGNPTSIKRLLAQPIEDIITYGNQVLRGLVNNNQGAEITMACIESSTSFNIPLPIRLHVKVISR